MMKHRTSSFCSLKRIEPTRSRWGSSSLTYLCSCVYLDRYPSSSLQATLHALSRVQESPRFGRGRFRRGLSDREGERQKGECLNLGSHGSFINHVTQLFAVKRLKVGPHQPSAPNLVDEVFVLGQLCHPNIVSFVDLIEARQHKFIVMEYCEGGDLRNMISKASLSM